MLLFCWTAHLIVIKKNDNKDIVKYHVDIYSSGYMDGYYRYTIGDYDNRTENLHTKHHKTKLNKTGQPPASSYILQHSVSEMLEPFNCGHAISNGYRWQRLVS